MATSHLSSPIFLWNSQIGFRVIGIESKRMHSWSASESTGESSVMSNLSSWRNIDSGGENIQVTPVNFHEVNENQPTPVAIASTSSIRMIRFFLITVISLFA